MIRIPDTYYTQQTLEGNPISDPLKNASPTFSQGTDILFSFYLSYEGTAITFEKWSLTGILKKNQYANNILYTTKEGSGLGKMNNVDGFFYYLMPASVSAQFLSGTYYIDIVGTQKAGTGVVKDLTLVLTTIAIVIELTPSSPNPKLQAFSIVTTSIDPTTDILTATVTGTESTMPSNVDTSRF